MLDTINTTKTKYYLVLYIMHDKKEFFVQFTDNLEKADVKYFTYSAGVRQTRPSFANCLPTHKARYEWFIENRKNTIEQMTLAVVESDSKDKAKMFVKSKRASIVDALQNLDYKKI